MLETTVGAVIFIDKKRDDIFYVEHLKAILNLLQIEAFNKIEIVLKERKGKKQSCWYSPNELFDELS